MIAKVKELDSKIKTNFVDNKAPKEDNYYTCIACVTIDCFENRKEKLSASLFGRT